jgi:hypothetical protein
MVSSSSLGKLLSGLVVLVLAADGLVSLAAPGLIEAEMAITGFPPGLTPALGLIMLASALLYAVPRTAFMGAVLVTGFLGGALCMHFRLGEIGSPPQIVTLLLGLLTWGGLYLRDERVRELLPLVAG